MPKPQADSHDAEAVRAYLAARGAQSLAASYPRLTDTDELFSEHRDDLVALIERVRTRLRLVADGLATAFFAPPLAPRRLGSTLASPVAPPSEEVTG